MHLLVSLHFSGNDKHRPREASGAFALSFTSDISMRKKKKNMLMLIHSFRDSEKHVGHAE